MQLTLAWMQRLSTQLLCAPGDLIDETGGSLPIDIEIAAAFSEQAPATFDVMKPPRLQAPPGLRDPGQCAAGHVLDNSADRLYPPGSTVIYRRREHLGERIRRGAKVVVRHYTTSRADGLTMEILVGLLDAATTGDVVLLTRSTERRVPASVIIQPALLQMSGGFGDRFSLSPDLMFGPDIRYEARPGDPAEILGVVVMAITPE